MSNYNGYGVSASGANDGTIDVTVGGGTSSYTYAWTATNGGVVPTAQVLNQDLTDLVIGTYTVTITDSNGCLITDVFVVTEPGEFLISEVLESHVDVLCHGDNTGALEVSITGGATPYTYVLSGGATETVSNTASLNYIKTGLSEGDYTVTVTDANGTQLDITITILQPDAPIDITLIPSDYGDFNIGCFGVADGSIDIVTTGGGGLSNSDIYTYEWTLDGEPFPISSPSLDTNLQNLGPGTYEVLVTDFVGCTYSEIYILTEPEDVTIIVDSEVDILCNGAVTGSISITAQGGTGVYEYFWTLDGEQFEDIEDISNLGPGEYVLLVEDSNGCFESEVFLITQPDPIVITVDSTVDILCFGDFTGSIDISVTGGVADYSYSWTGPNTYTSEDQNISGLEAGIYELTLTDDNNCSTFINVELFQPEDLIINYTSTDETCTNANDGTIVLDILGGVEDYDISWNNFGNGTTQSNLAPGSYVVTVVDANNCIEEITIEIIAAPLFDITTVVNSITCFGEDDGNIQLNIEGGIAPVNVLWADNASAGEDRFNLGPGIYSVIVTDSSGFSCTIEREFVIVEPAEIISSGVITNALDCDIVESGAIDLQVSGGTLPYTFLWSNGEDTEDLTNIPPGNYAVTITDFNGCSVINEFKVDRPEEITTELITSFSSDCENHIAFQTTTAVVQGGIPPYDISWSNGAVTGDDGEIMTTSQNGTYLVDITDSLGCSVQFVFDVNLEEIGYPDFSYDSFTLSNCDILSVDDPIQFNNLSSGDYISVDWMFNDGSIPLTNIENPVHIFTEPGTYYVTQTVNYPYGCSYDIIQELEVTKGYEIILPNAFTPNGDGINDTIRPIYNCMDNVQLSIYDTWGALIFSEIGDDIYGWDGTINGKPAENGNYIIVVRAEAWNGKTVDINGPITLIK